MEKVLITGASGLLGSALLERIVNTKMYEVYAVTTNKSRITLKGNFSIKCCDLRVEEQRRKLVQEVKPDIIIHLAWNQENEKFRNSKTNQQWLQISKDILHLFKENGGKKFIFSGSSSEYDGAIGVFDETVDVEPVSLYGKCKKAFNMYANDYCNECGIRYVGMRIFTMYGDNDRHEFGSIPSIFTALSSGKRVECINPYTTRDFVYVYDVADIILVLLTDDFNGIINIASGKSMHMREVFECIAEKMGCMDKIDINKENDVEVRFDADISLMKSLGLDRCIGEFEKNIEYVIKKRRLSI